MRSRKIIITGWEAESSSSPPSKKIPKDTRTIPDANGCRFCRPYADDIVAKNELCYARWDRFPVSKGHLLIIPFRHTADYFSLTGEEK